MKQILAAILILFLWIGEVSPWPILDRNVIDLTYVFDESTIGWPTDKRFEMTVTQNGTTEDGYWYQSEEYGSGTHVGTHLDAPAHAALGKWTVEQIPLNRLMAPAAVVDISQKATEDRDASLSVQDLLAWEFRFGQKLDHKILLVRSGWGQKWPDEEDYLGNANKDLDDLHFPAISPEAARWLVDKRKIYGVGIDTPSLDHGNDLKTHEILMEANIYGMENIANLEKVPQFGAILFVSPMKMKNASGAPARVVAYVPRR